MLQYLIILLDDTSTSFCHYEIPQRERKLIPLDTLRQGIRFAMMENLMIQFVYPDYELPAEYSEIVESIDHSKIKPKANEADVMVVSESVNESVEIPVVWRIGKERLFNEAELVTSMLEKTPRLNIVITDVESFTDDDFEQYKTLLGKLSESIEKMYVEGKHPQLTLLTDRMMLTQMNNCGAGDMSITLAPNGKS